MPFLSPTILGGGKEGHLTNLLAPREGMLINKIVKSPTIPPVIPNWGRWGMILTAA